MSSLNLNDDQRFVARIKALEAATTHAYRRFLDELASADDIVRDAHTFEQFLVHGEVPKRGGIEVPEGAAITRGNTAPCAATGST